MADFAAVLRKTIDGLGSSTPEMRQRVYQRARATVEEKLTAANAGPDAASRQRQALAQAIVEVERGYAAEGKAKGGRATPAKSPLGSPQARADATRAPASAENPRSSKQSARPNDTAVPQRSRSAQGGQSAPRKEVHSAALDSSPSDFDDIFFGSEGRPDKPRTPAPAATKAKPGAWGASKRRAPSRLPVAAIAAVVAVAAIGIVAWEAGPKIGGLFGGHASTAARQQEAATTPPTADKQAASPQVPAPEATAAPQQPASASKTTPQPSDKFTQRLLPSGQEVDPGPAVAKPGTGEGTSLAAQNVKAANPAAQADAAAPAAVQEGQPSPSAAATVPVGQKAFFYEERTGQEASTAETGAVVWSEIQQSPGNDLPPEPAIRADVTIPQNGMKLRLTIQRNADKSLPASHLVELVFTLPDGFRGGSIDNVQRVAFKDTEQVAGDPLIAIPAKIADNFFIVALNDATNAVATNLSLMQREEWIDIPMTYRTGRRALITLEKGVPGDKVFEDVLKAWGEKAGG
jgi:hypothetical protein